MKLQYNSEVVGVLKGIRRENEEIVLTFEICKTIKVPFSSHFDKNIYNYINKEIGILNLEAGVIKVREI